jgi:signal transduction histidine kinase
MAERNADIPIVTVPPGRRLRDLDPFLGLELLILITSQISIVFSTDPNFVPAWMVSIGCLAFSALVAVVPLVRDRPRAIALLVVVEIAMLVGLVMATANGAIIALSLAFILRNTDLLAPSRAVVASACGIAIAIVAMVTVSMARGQDHAATIDTALALLMAIGITGALASFAAAERRAAIALRAAHEELRRQAERAVERAAQSERARIAADLHDAIGHALTALNVQLQSAMRLRAHRPDEADALVASALELGLGALADVRSTVGALRADPLERDPLDRVLARVVARHEACGGPRIESNVEAWSDQPAIATVVARIAEEAIVNAIKHAGARCVQLGLRATPDGVAELEVRDDGCGFDPSAQVSGHGLQIMRERARDAGIDLALHSVPGDGTRVRLQWYRVPAV